VLILSRNKMGVLAKNILRSQIKDCIQYKFIVTISARYSILIVEREIINCFLEHHDMRLRPRNKQPVVVKRWLSSNPAQSELKNTLREKEDTRRKVIP